MPKGPNLAQIQGMRRSVAEMRFLKTCVCGLLPNSPPPPESSSSGAPNTSSEVTDTLKGDNTPRPLQPAKKRVRILLRPCFHHVQTPPPRYQHSLPRTRLHYISALGVQVLSPQSARVMLEGALRSPATWNPIRLGPEVATLRLNPSRTGLSKQMVRL